MAVVLFDIDGTLVDCGGAGRRSMRAAFERRHRRPDACDAIVFGGMTDRAIARAGLEAIGEAAIEAHIEALVGAYLEALVAELRDAPGYRVLAGSVAAVEHAASRGHAVGLGTGNVRRGAELKLEKAGLLERFGFGGFGCDAEDRAALLRRGAERGRARAGVDAEVIVVGDTPRDVVAAHAIGAKCLAVSTGRFDAPSLSAAGADLVVDRLDRAEALAFLD